MNATLHVISRGVIPFGALAGGALSDAIGLPAPQLFCVQLHVLACSLKTRRARARVASSMR